MIPVPQAPGCRGLLFLPIVFSLLLIASLSSVQAQSSQSGLVIQADIDGTITRATLDYITEILEVAEQENAQAIILRLDTPGGGVAETEKIVQLMLNSSVPIIGYVNPVGASADSAGTWILMATDVAAMTPGTTIGSLQPVIIGPEGFQPIEDDKIINNVVAKVRNVLALHGRNESLADAFVRENLNLNAEDAVQAGAIELTADSPEHLLLSMSGMVTHYKGIQLSFSDPDIQIRGPSIRVRAIVIISDPVLGSILLLLGIYGVIFGISTPGHGAEVFGVIAVSLGVIALGFSISLISIFLITLGVALIIVEITTPSFGAIGTGGIISILLGSLFLAPIRPPTFLIAPAVQLRILLALMIPTAVVGGFLLFALYKVLQVRKQKPFHDRFIGGTAIAVDALAPGKKGYVRYEGELWQAITEDEIQPEETVFILARDGPVLTVDRKPPEPPG
ncbi:MAG: nodulation protein NfeD [Thermoplasmata archaeon]